jgi:hypothetical protein
MTSAPTDILSSIFYHDLGYEFSFSYIFPNPSSIRKSWFSPRRICTNATIFIFSLDFSYHFCILFPPFHIEFIPIVHLLQYRSNNHPFLVVSYLGRILFSRRITSSRRNFFFGLFSNLLHTPCLSFLDPGVHATFMLYETNTPCRNILLNTFRHCTCTPSPQSCFFVSLLRRYTS